ncbi:hypothetical protein [Neptunicoccus cionae]|uniref:hypothetical protein n=1 Tax=Neptunicoccus cionae TaxID=2035344 RepID=UPI000C788E72|nr:hypothetical protein [Amylibacter cionae]PLS23601.1 hypothetical protein C0U40_05720 [Amylibacter cionae]
MMRFFGAVALVPLGMACTPVTQDQTPDASKAEKQAQVQAYCTEQAKNYARRPLVIADETGRIQIGLQAVLPDQDAVNQYYKDCYRAQFRNRPAKSAPVPDDIPSLPAYG